MAINTLPLFADAGKFYVYVYRDPRPKKKNAPIYVGKGLAKIGRADVHWRGVAENRLLRRILNKINNAGLEPIIEVIAWYDDEKAAFECEMRLIAKYGRRDIKKGPLCNFTDGGEGCSGRVTSEETKKKISKAHKGRKQSPEQCEAASRRMKLYMSNPENRAMCAEKTRQVMQSAEARARISQTLKEKGQTDACKAALEKAWSAARGTKYSDERKAKAAAAYKAMSAIRKRKSPPKSAEEIARRQATRAANRAAKGIDRY